MMAPVPAKLTFPLASGRRLGGAIVLIVPAAFLCVVRSRSVKKKSLFFPFQTFGPPSPKCGNITGPLKAYPNWPTMFLGIFVWFAAWKKFGDSKRPFVLSHQHAP